MEIRISHTFPCSPKVYWETAWDPAFERELRAEAEVDFTVLEERIDGQRAFTRTRISPRRELPLLAQKALGQTRFSYVQEVDSDNINYTTRWRVTADVMSDRLKCSGVSRIVDGGDTCERVIEGSIDVAIPLVGGAVERQIVSEIERSYERAADVIRRHLSKD